MNKIKISVIVISLFLLMGASCQDSLRGGSRVSGGSREISYTGNEGLTIEFIEGMPPKNIWKDVEFDVGIDVQNKGLVDVKEGKVCFSLHEALFSTSGGGCKTLNELMGRLNLPEGDIESYIWEGFNLKESYSKDTEYPLTAKVCYKGETITSPSACIKSITQGMDSVCDAGELKLDSGGQGAPVAVSSVYEDIIPRKEGGIDVRFTITVDNVDSGEIIKLDSINKENCNFDREDKNEVEITANLVGVGELECGKNNNKIIKITQDGQGIILCKGSIDVEEGESFPLPLNIKLNYGYLSTTSGGFTIKKDIYEEVI